MSGSTPNDDLVRVFKQTYQTVVDLTPLPGEALPAPSLIRQPQRPRGPMVAAAVAVAVLAFGGIAFLTRDPYQFAGPAERLALVEVPAGLGGEPEVTFAEVGDTTGMPPLPSSEMWIWEAEDGVEQPSVALFEVDLGADTGILIGRTERNTSLVPPDPGEVAREVLPEFGWHVASWTASDRWRIVVGFDEEEVGRLAQIIGDHNPSTVEIQSRELAYQGPQILRAPEGADIPVIVYGSPAGQFAVALAQDWPEMMTLAGLSAPVVSHLSVNGMPAASFESNETIRDEGYAKVEQVRTIIWPIDGNTSGWVFGIDIPEDLLLEVAEGVRPVSVEEWEEIASTSTGEGFR